MEKEKYFIIYLEDFLSDDLTKNSRWTTIGPMFEDYEEAKQAYKKVDKHCRCKICKTIYG